MDEIIKLVTERAGIPSDKARLAVDAVLGYVKQKMPPALASQVDSVFAGRSVSDIATGFGETAKEGLGGMFGKNS